MKSRIRKAASIICAAAVASTTVVSVPASASKDVSNLSASEICAEMGMGWNLGNTLDATGGSGVDSETSWGNPKTTKAMIHAVKEQGFTCVRIPTTWGNHLDSNYTIDGNWITRVKEVVDYCIDEDMYVILNSHHDEWNKPIDSNYTAASHELKVVWKQIATTFQGYDRHLVFEGMNEPRNYNGEHEWDGGTPEMHNVINKLNADFVSTVRATGGNNTNRCLMIPTYAASAEYAAMADLTIPKDDNIIVSIHSYSPFKFAFDSPGTDKFTDDMAAELDTIFKNYSNLFVSNGIPVCVGEFSATNKNNLEERTKWATYYAKKAKELGISCMLWDNNRYYDGGSESHGHLNRNDLTWYDKPVVDALINSYKNTKTDIPKPLELPDLNTADVTVLSDKTMSASGYDPTPGVLFDFTKMKKGSFIAVNFTGSAAPLLVVQDNRAWKVWAQVSPIAIKDSVAFYSYDDIVSTYTNSYKGAYGEEPASTLAQAFQLFTTGNGSAITVNKILYVEPGEKPDDNKDISKCDISVTPSRVYSGAAIKPAVTVKDGSKTLKNGTDYTVSYANNTNVGTASVTITGKGDYKGTVKKTFTITTKKLSDCDVSLKKTSYAYNGTSLKPSAIVKIGNKTISADNYTVKYENNRRSGTATVTITGKGNLRGSVKKTFTITKRALSACDVTLEKTSYNYTGKLIKPVVTVKVNGVVVYKGTYTVTYKNNKNKGTATVTITANSTDSDLKGSVSKTFTIK